MGFFYALLPIALMEAIAGGPENLALANRDE